MLHHRPSRVLAAPARVCLALANNPLLPELSKLRLLRFILSVFKHRFQCLFTPKLFCFPRLRLSFSSIPDSVETVIPQGAQLLSCSPIMETETLGCRLIH